MEFFKSPGARAAVALIITAVVAVLLIVLLDDSAYDWIKAIHIK